MGWLCRTERAFVRSCVCAAGGRRKTWKLWLQHRVSSLIHVGARGHKRNQITCSSECGWAVMFYVFSALRHKKLPSKQLGFLKDKCHTFSLSSFRVWVSQAYPVLAVVASVACLVRVRGGQQLLSRGLFAFCRFPCHQCLLSAQ